MNVLALYAYIERTLQMMYGLTCAPDGTHPMDN